MPHCHCLVRIASKRDERRRKRGERTRLMLTEYGETLETIWSEM